jgi:hypothetical protein
MRRLLPLVPLLFSLLCFGAEQPKPQIRFGDLLVVVEGWKTDLFLICDVRQAETV